MITIDDKNKNYEVKLTIFPDGCPQVWNLPPYLLEESVSVTWKFEDLTEFWTLAQIEAVN